MKRIFSFFTVFIILILLVLPAGAADLEGGYFFTADCALGNDVTFYISSGSFSDLTFDSSGDLFNLGNNTVYLYCPAHPDYSIRAARFSNFVYSVTNGYNPTTYDLNITAINDSNVSFMVDTPAYVSTNTLLVVVIAVVFLFAFVLIFLYRRG